jgi:hypothetical protein
MRSRHYETLRTAFPEFGWREVRGEAREFMDTLFAFVVEAPDGTLHGAVPMATEEDEDGWVRYAPLDGHVEYERPSAEAIEASGYRLLSA